MKMFLAGMFVTSVILLSGCGGTGNSSNKNSNLSLIPQNRNLQLTPKS